MMQKKRFQFKNNADKKGWLNTTGASHIERADDIFIRPTNWGLFKWNAENKYPAESAISTHDTEVDDLMLVCRPIEFL